MKVVEETSVQRPGPREGPGQDLPPALEVGATRAATASDHHGATEGKLSPWAADWPRKITSGSVSAGWLRGTNILANPPAIPLKVSRPLGRRPSAASSGVRPPRPVIDPTEYGHICTHDHLVRDEHPAHGHHAEPGGGRQCVGSSALVFPAVRGRDHYRVSRLPSFRAWPAWPAAAEEAASPTASVVITTTPAQQVHLHACAGPGGCECSRCTPSASVHQAWMR